MGTPYYKPQPCTLNGRRRYHRTRSGYIPIGTRRLICCMPPPIGLVYIHALSANQLTTSGIQAHPTLSLQYFSTSDRSPYIQDLSATSCELPEIISHLFLPRARLRESTARESPPQGARDSPYTCDLSQGVGLTSVAKGTPHRSLTSFEVYLHWRRPSI